MKKLVSLLNILVSIILLGGCVFQPQKDALVDLTASPATPIQSAIPPSKPTVTPISAIPETPAHIQSQSMGIDCTAIEHLPPDSIGAQQILDEFVTHYKNQYPTEYMGFAVLHRVERLREWLIVTGSVAGEGKDVIVVRQTSSGHRIVEQIRISAPLESTKDFETQVVRYLMEKLPEAPPLLFTCLDRDWLLAVGYPNKAAETYKLVYISTDNGDTTGVSEIRTIDTNGDQQSLLLSAQMLILGLRPSPDGTRIAFWGCPGSFSSDCTPGDEEDLDIWVVNTDGMNLNNLTKDSPEGDSHPDWSPDGNQIVFDSWRSGKADIYIMQADGRNVRPLTSSKSNNTEPKWSPDGKWIAYHCSQEGETGICLLSPDGQMVGKPISGTMPTWSPIGEDGDLRLAYLCFLNSQSDICTSRPDGSEFMNLTRSPADEHSPVWSPDGKWIAFVSNQAGDIDIYKVCSYCEGAPFKIRLTDEARSANWPTWSPDGKKLAYADDPGGSLMVVNADRSDATYLAGEVFGPPIWIPHDPAR